MHNKLCLSFIFVVVHVGTINNYLSMFVKVCLGVSDREMMCAIYLRLLIAMKSLCGKRKLKGLLPNTA